MIEKAEIDHNVSPKLVLTPLISFPIKISCVRKTATYSCDIFNHIEKCKKGALWNNRLLDLFSFIIFKLYGHLAVLTATSTVTQENWFLRRNYAIPFLNAPMINVSVVN